MKSRRLLFAVALMAHALPACAIEPSKACPAVSVPAEAKITFTHGVDFAQFPHPLPTAYTGCSYAWLGDGEDPKSMKPLTISYFISGKVQWLSATEPKNRNFYCTYSNGELVESESQNFSFCPEASDLEAR